MKSKVRLEKLILAALFTALITVTTITIAIPIPFTNGYIHPGDSMIFIAVLMLGWKYGATAAALGSALADLYLGYIHWVPATFVIKGGMAMIVGIILLKTLDKRRNLIFACLAMAGGWLLFHFAVQGIIRFTATNSPAMLLDAAGVTSVSALGEVLNSLQSKLMLIALLIPVALLVISLVLRKRENVVIPIGQIVAMSAGGMFMVFGYYIAGGVMMGNFAVPIFSIPANILQFVAGFFIAALVSGALEKTPARRYFAYSVRRENSGSSN